MRVNRTSGNWRNRASGSTDRRPCRPELFEVGWGERGPCLPYTEVESSTPSPWNAAAGSSPEREGAVGALQGLHDGHNPDAPAYRGGEGFPQRLIRYVISMSSVVACLIKPTSTCAVARTGHCPSPQGHEAAIEFAPVAEPVRGTWRLDCKNAAGQHPGSRPTRPVPLLCSFGRGRPRLPVGERLIVSARCRCPSPYRLPCCMGFCRDCFERSWCSGR
jgi:hypothetical protein